VKASIDKVAADKAAAIKASIDKVAADKLTAELNAKKAACADNCGQWNNGGCVKFPCGSYLKSCSDCSMSGSTLYCTCKGRNGNSSTRLDNAWNYNNKITNDNGNLRYTT
jgi:hypothetical protein